MADFLANAVVQITADAKQFLAELNTVVQQAEKKIVNVQVAPNTKGFVAETNRQLKQAKFAPVRVRVIPDLTGFKTAVRTAALDAVRGLNIPVATAPRSRVSAGGGGTSAATDTAAKATRTLITAEQRLADAQAAGAFARRRIIGDMDVQAKRALRLERELVSLKTAESAVTQALKERNAVVAELAVTERNLAQQAVSKTQRQIQEEDFRRGAPGRAAEEKARAEEAEAALALKNRVAAEKELTKIHSDALKENSSLDREAAAAQKLRDKQIADTWAAHEAEKTASTAKGTQARIAFFKAEDAAEAKAASGATSAGQKETETFKAAQAQVAPQSSIAFSRREEELRAESEKTARARITDEKKAFDELDHIREKEFRAELADIERTVSAQEAADRKRLTMRARFEEQFARFGRPARRGFDPDAGSTALLTKRNQLQAAGVDLAELRNKAIRAGLPTLAADIELLRVHTAALAQDAELARANAAANEQRTKTFGQARNAIQGQIATLFGLRGAALSAEGAFLAAAAGVIAVTKALQASAQFESQLNVFAVTAGATADEMERVRDVSSALGKDITLPGVGAQDAAEALTLLSKAGLGVQDSIDGARGVLQLATAAGIENAEATELAASALNAFGLAGDQAVRVADVLANAANAAQGSIVDIGVALQQSSAVARQAGLSLEQTTAVLTLFARAGLRGSDAGTSFRTALIRLINPTKKAQSQIDKLGLSVRTSTGAINLDVFDEFAKKTRNLTAAQRDQALAIIFGQDAIRGAAILAREGSAGLDAQVQGLKKSGTAADLAAARMTGLTGATENVKNQIGALGITIGAILTPAVEDAATNFGHLVGSIDAVLSPVATLIREGNKLRKSLTDAFTVDIAGFEVGAASASNTIQNATKNAQRVGQVFFNSSEDIKFARVALQGFILELNKSGGSATKLNETILGLQELQKRFQGGDAAAQRFASDIGALIIQLQKVGEQDVQTDFNFVIPPEILNGKTGELAGKATKDGFVRGFKITIGFGAFIAQAGAAGKAAASEAGDKFNVKDVTEGINRQLRSGTGKLNVLEGQALDIELKGGPSKNKKLLANLAKREEEALNQIRLERARLKPGQLSSPALRQAQSDLKGIQDDEQGIREEIQDDADQAVEDAKRAARELQDTRNEADRAFFDALAPAQARVERQSIKAEGTERLDDDRAALVAQKQLLLREIALIDQGVKDRKVANAEIDKRRTQIISLDNDIAENEQAIVDSAFERRQNRLVQRQESFEAVGDIQGQIRAINRRIEGYNDLLRTLRGEKSAFQKYIDERAELRRQREQLEDDALSQQIELGQSIFAATGNKNPLLRAINAAIQDTKEEIAAAKKAGQSTVQLRIELNNLIAQRKQTLEDAAEDAKDTSTSAFDLLKQAAETFNASAGNLISGNQPFPGPTGFTADIAQWLQRQRPQAQTGLGVTTTGQFAPSDSLSRNDQGHFQNLIAAIDRNTDAINGRRGNRSTASGPLDRLHADRANFHEATQSRKIVENRGGI